MKLSDLKFNEDGVCHLVIGDSYQVDVTRDERLSRYVLTSPVAAELPEETDYALMQDLLNFAMGPIFDGSPAVGRDPSSGLLIAYSILPFALVPMFIRVFLDSRTAFMSHVMMILIFSSCKDENSFMSVDDEPCYSILISAPGADATRATYKEEGEDLAVVWEKGDVIYVGDYEFVFKEMQGNDALFFHYGDIANAASWTGTVSYGSTVDLTSQFQKKNNTCGEHLEANVTNINLNNKPTISLLPADNMSLLHVRVKAPVMLLGSSMMKVEGLDKSDVYTVTLGNDPSHVFADKDEPIDLDEIIKVNDLVSPILDKADLIQTEYVLDVTTFGAEKKIDVKRLEKYIGKFVNIHLSHPYKGMNIIEGDLVSADNDYVIITYKEKTRVIKCEIERKYIDKARLAIKF